MRVRTSALLFAAVTLFQLAHGIPTHRVARGAADSFQTKIKDYITQLQGHVPSSSSSEKPSESSGAQSETSSQYETASSSGSAEAASEPEASIVAKEGTSNANGVQSYIPSSMGSYSNYFNPSQMSQQYPSSFNPNQFSQYIPSNFNGNANPATAAAPGSSGAASEPEASIAAREGTSNANGVQSYIPSQMGSYSNYFNPSQMSQQYPSSFNPNQFSQYIPSNFNGNANPATAAAPGSSGAASEPEASIAAKEGTSNANGVQSYIPSQMGSYTSYFNPSQMNQQYPSTFNPNQFSQYIPSNFNNNASPGGAAAGTTGAASDPQPSIL